MTNLNVLLSELNTLQSTNANFNVINAKIKAIKEECAQETNANKTTAIIALVELSTNGTLDKALFMENFIKDRKYQTISLSNLDTKTNTYSFKEDSKSILLSEVESTTQVCQNSQVFNYISLFNHNITLHLQEENNVCGTVKSELSSSLSLTNEGLKPLLDITPCFKKHTKNGLMSQLEFIVSCIIPANFKNIDNNEFKILKQDLNKIISCMDVVKEETGASITKRDKSLLVMIQTALYVRYNNFAYALISKSDAQKIK